MTRRRWIADTWDEATAALHGDQAQHLSRVLRAQPGMEFDVIAGGRAWLARIASIDRDSVRFTLLDELETAAALPVTLLLSVFKFDRMEWAIEKASSSAAAASCPSSPSGRKNIWPRQPAKRAERWRRLALEAAKQSRRSDLPEIAEPTRLAAFLPRTERQAHQDSVPEGTASGPLRILLSETEEDQPLLRILQQNASQAEAERNHAGQSDRKADGLRRKLHCSHAPAGTAPVSGRASCGWKPPPSPRWRS